MAKYSVLVPIAGHIRLDVEADNAEDAIEAAFSSDDLCLENIENWEALDTFTSGNVCWCPQPWKPVAKLDEEE